MEPRKPMLNRLYFDSDGEEKVLDFEKSVQGFYTRGTAEERALWHAIKSPRAVFDAGWLPEITIRPPKDNAVYKANYMIPNKELRNQFYNSINRQDEFDGNIKDTRTYINKLWDLYIKSSKPTIKPVGSRFSPGMMILQKMGVVDGDETRATYDNIFNTMYVDPEDAAEDIVAEMAHAYQFHGTDTPRTWTWMKQFLSRPNGDIVINGSDGYDTPGSLEYNAHNIIEPRFNMYLTGNYPYGFIWDSIQKAYNKKPRLIKAGPKINTYIP